MRPTPPLSTRPRHLRAPGQRHSRSTSKLLSRRALSSVITRRQLGHARVSGLRGQHRAPARILAEVTRCTDPSSCSAGWPSVPPPWCERIGTLVTNRLSRLLAPTCFIGSRLRSFAGDHPRQEAPRRPHRGRCGCGLPGGELLGDARLAVGARCALIGSSASVTTPHLPHPSHRYGLPARRTEPNRLSAPSRAQLVEFPCRRPGSMACRCRSPVGLFPHPAVLAHVRGPQQIERSGRPFTFYLAPLGGGSRTARIRVGRYSRFRRLHPSRALESRLRRVLGDFPFTSMRAPLGLRTSGSSPREAGVRRRPTVRCRGTPPL